MKTSVIKDLSDKKILIFDRNSDVFQKMVRGVAKEFYNISVFDTVSEYRISRFYIDLSRYSITDLTFKDYELLEKIDVRDIILRDRWLREMSEDKAVRRVKECFKECLEFFTNHHYDYIFTQIVDNYVMDILFRVASLFNIETIGICRFFVDGYYRITLYGENNNIREVEKKETLDVIEKLKDKQFKSSMAPSFIKAFKKSLLLYVKYKVKRFYHFFFYSKVLRRTEYDFRADFVESAYPKSIISAFSYWWYCKSLGRVKAWSAKSEKKIAYIPLHYFPEATIDYWASEVSCVNYLQSIVKTVENLKARKYKIIFKEHPAMAFSRQREFYKEIYISCGEDGIICSPFVSSREVFDLVDISVVWTGSVGVESVLADKPVIKVCDTYYSGHPKFLPIDSTDEPSLFTEDEKIEMMQDVLRGTLVS